MQQNETPNFINPQYPQQDSFSNAPVCYHTQTFLPNQEHSQAPQKQEAKHSVAYPVPVFHTKSQPTVERKPAAHKRIVISERMNDPKPEPTKGSKQLLLKIDAKNYQTDCSDEDTDFF